MTSKILLCPTCKEPENIFDIVLNRSLLEKLKTQYTKSF